MYSASYKLQIVGYFLGDGMSEIDALIKELKANLTSGVVAKVEWASEDDRLEISIRAVKPGRESLEQVEAEITKAADNLRIAGKLTSNMRFNISVALGELGE